MKTLEWSVLAVLVVAAGCAKRVETPHDTPETPPPDEQLTDDFGLPLVITILAPEVPEAIRGPSPPIIEKSPKEQERPNGGSKKAASSGLPNAPEGSAGS